MTRMVLGLLAGLQALVLVQHANAASVNCSYELCLARCRSGGWGQAGCNMICTKTMQDRQKSGQCKK